MMQIPNWPYYFADPRGAIYSTKSGTLKKLKPTIDSRAHYTVKLCHNGKGYTRNVGRLILETFVGPRPKGMVMCHGPKGKLNDDIENLSWDTLSKNLGQDKLRDGTDNRGEKHNGVILRDVDVQEIRNMPRKYGTIKPLAKKLGVKPCTIYSIRAFRHWRHIK